MTLNSLNEIAETYLNGNISDAKASVKKLSKKNLLAFVQVLACFYEGQVDDHYKAAFLATNNLLNN